MMNAEAGRACAPAAPHRVERRDKAGALLAALTPHLRSFGITRVGDLTGLDVIGIPVAFATRPNSRSLSVSQGKALGLDEARLGAVMESLEQAFGEREEDLVIERCTTGHLKERGVRLVDLSRLSRVSRAPDDDEIVAWSSTTSLLDGAVSLAPFELVGLDLRATRNWNVDTMPVSSLGLAAGSTWEQAATHALLETIEHNATAALDVLGFLPFLARPLIYRTGADAALDEITGRIENAGFAYRLYDISDAGGPPVIAAYIDCQDIAPGTIRFAGFACRFTPEEAAEAALLEAVQSRLTLIAGARDDQQAEEYRGRKMSAPRPGRSAMPLDAVPCETRHLRHAAPATQLRAAMDAARALGATDIHVSRLGEICDLACVVRVLVPGIEASGFNATAKGRDASMLASQPVKEHVENEQTEEGFGLPATSLKVKEARGVLVAKRIKAVGEFLDPGGNPFSRGSLNHLIRNRVYVGEVFYKGSIYVGQHEGIVDRELFEQAQAIMETNRRVKLHRPSTTQKFPLTSLIFDDRGNPMAPSQSQKGGSRRYRYYVKHRVQTESHLLAWARAKFERDSALHRVCANRLTHFYSA